MARLAARAHPNRILISLMGRENWGRYREGQEEENI
jgi:hypothetical protein